MIEQKTDKWFKRRVGKVTASRVGAILGLNRYSSAEDVLREMVREYYGAEREFIGNRATEWGEAHENDALSALEADRGVFVEATGFHVHPDYDWLGASPDGLIGADTIVEVKCPYSQKLVSIHDHQSYLAQMRLQMAVTGRDKGVFVVWTPNGHSIEDVAYPDGWLEGQLPTLEAFYTKYLSLIGDEGLAKPYLADSEQVREDSDWLVAAEKYQQCKRDMERIKAEMDSYKSTLIDLAGGYRSRGGGVLVYPVKGRVSTDYKKALSENGITDLSAYQKAGKESWSIKIDERG